MVVALAHTKSDTIVSQMTVGKTEVVHLVLFGELMTVELLERVSYEIPMENPQATERPTPELRGKAPTLMPLV